MSTVNAVRRAILVAFVGATLWVVAPVIIYQPPQPATSRTDWGKYFGVTPQPNEWTGAWGRDYSDGSRMAFARALRPEIVVVTFAAIAWVFAGLVKPRA
jgi:hypothetical protein